MKKIKTIIIGLGNIGLNYDYNLSQDYILTHSKAIDRNKNFKILCGIDKDQNQLFKFNKKYKKPIFKSLFSFNKLYKNIKIDFVVISVQEKYHLKIIRQLFKFCKPKVILCEKPLSTNKMNAKKITNLCEENEVKLFINYTRNTDRNFNYLNRFLKKKSSGVVRYRKPFIKNASHFLALFRKVIGKINYIKKDKLNNFVVCFKNSKILFKVEKNKNLQNTYKIKNQDFSIELKNNSFLVLNNLTKNIELKKPVDKKNNEKVILHVEKYFKKKQNNLVDSNIALEIWNFMDKI